MEEKSTKTSETVLGGKQVKRPIFIKFFWAFLVSSVLTAGAMVYILYLALSHLKEMSPEVTLNLKEIIGGQVLLIILFVLIPAIFFAVVNSQSIGDPIRKISQSLKEIAKGNLDIRIRTERRDELGNLIDIFNEMTDKLKEVRQKNNEVSKLKSTFIGVASHQLRTPSTGITWALQELLAKNADPLTEKQRKLVEQCQARNMEAIRIVDELMTVVQIEEQEYGYMFQEVRISSLISSLVEEYKIQASFNQMNIIFHDKLGEDTVVEGDPEKLLMVFRNLMQNALQYASKGTNIEVEAEKGEKNISVKISDYGMPIPPEDEDKIFIKFFRSEDAIRTKPNGSGAGLYISKQIIEHHKGSIRASSALAEGKTTFTVELPLFVKANSQRKDMEDLFKTM
jgi:signal transduction histidine kinase